MSTCRKKLFLSFPDSDDVVPQPLNAWQNKSAYDLPDPKPPAIWWIGMNPKFI